ncbi:hypothetical protein LCGC14_2662180, partial [marine sediment metagenome]
MEIAEMKPYYQDEWVTQYCSDTLTTLTELESDSIDLLCTDPPYGISFMGKAWDKALPDINIWKECFRVLKPGALAFVMSIPRSDCLSRMIISLEDAGFRVDFTPIFWTYASGFPKAQNIGKSVDKRLGVEREEKDNPLAKKQTGQIAGKGLAGQRKNNLMISNGKSAFEGSYGGFQPKPAVEVIIVAMKPLSEKTFVGQALKNGKGISWLDDCRIPYESTNNPATNPLYRKDAGYKNINAPDTGSSSYQLKDGTGERNPNPIGRFPANLLVSDDVLNTGTDTKSGKDAVRRQEGMFIDHHLGGVGNLQVSHPDSGSFSRYFDLDKWAQKTMPFLIVPKACKREKNQSLDMPSIELGHNRFDSCETCGGYLLQNPDRPSACKCENPIRENNKIKGNHHPTVKPLKLMSYLI